MKYLLWACKPHRAAPVWKNEKEREVAFGGPVKGSDF